MAEIHVTPASFIEAILLRPTMYTLNGAFGEVIAFLEGYANGIASGSPHAPPVTEWEAFRVWLAAQLEVETAEVFAAIQSRSSGDQTALEELAESLVQFRQECAA